VRPLKWAAALLVCIGLAGLPIAMWVSERWGLIFATLGTLGVILLGVFAKFGRRPNQTADGDD
jgi:hypothetical protein